MSVGCRPTRRWGSDSLPLPFPQSGDWIFLVDRGSVMPKNLKKCIKLNWNFQRGGGLRKEILFIGEL